MLCMTGNGTFLAVAILAIPQLGTRAISKSLEWLFMTLLPNFSLGQSVSDFYSNFMYLNSCKPYFSICHDYICPSNGTAPCCKGMIIYLYIYLLTYLFSYWLVSYLQG